MNAILKEGKGFLEKEELCFSTPKRKKYGEKKHIDTFTYSALRCYDDRKTGVL